MILGSVFLYASMKTRAIEQEFKRSVPACIADTQSAEQISLCVQKRAQKFGVQLNPAQIKIDFSEPYKASNVGAVIIVEKRTVTIMANFEVKSWLRSRKSQLNVSGDVIHQSKVIYPNHPNRLLKDAE